ncbi:MAG: choice-of-anchor H family protein [Gammaproteobacteria bacterium]
MNAIFYLRFRIARQLALAMLGLFICSAASGDVPDRISRSVAGFQGEYAEDEKRDPVGLQTFEPATESIASKRASLETVQQNASLCCAFWVYEARTRLFDDFDGDGHYSYLRVSFDIDTSYFEADVYVRLFLRGSNGAWNLIYHSEEFSIFGSSGNDEYEVETELVAGFPPDDYDVMIEVYEGFYGELVAEYGPADTSSLSYLPLEDVSFDSRLSPPVVVSSGGGGAASLDMLILLLFAALAMQRGDGSRKPPATRSTDRIGPLCWSDDSALSKRLAQSSHRRYVAAGLLVPPAIE